MNWPVKEASSVPQLFRIGSYVIYFWINEGMPLEPVHVHIAKVRPTANATKIWITRSGKCLLHSNSSQIPDRELRIMIKVIEARSADIIEKWKSTFGQSVFYC